MTTLTTEELARLAEAMNILREATDSSAASTRIVDEENRRVAAASERNSKAWVSAGAAGVSALNKFGSALLSTSDGMAKYNSSINTAGNAALNIGKSFGILGFAIGGAVKLFTLVAETVMKQNDALLKAYDTLSEFGQTASHTTSDILALGRASGYTSHTLEIFTKNASKVSQELAALSGSASEGLVTFGKLTKITQEQRNQYNRLGLSQEKVTQLQTDYVRQTLQAGISLSKSPELLRKSSLAYIDTLNELAAITGISTEKLQAAQDVANANENFNAYKFHMDQKRQAALERGDKAEADRIAQVIKVKDESAKLAVNTMSAANAAAYLQGISTEGATVWTAASAKLMLAGVDVTKQNAEMNKGNSQIVDMLESQVKAAKSFDSRFGELGHAFGEHSIEIQKIFGNDNKMRETAAAWSRLSTQAEKDAFIEKLKITKDDLSKKKDGIGLVDKLKDVQNAQFTAELRARQAMDDLTKTIAGPVNSAFRSLLSAVNALGKGIGYLISMIPGMGPTGKKIMDQFRDPEEIKERNEKIASERKALAEQIARSEEIDKVKLEAFKELDTKEKKSKDDLVKATAAEAMARAEAAAISKSGTIEEKKAAQLKISTAVLAKGDAEANHRKAVRELESAKVQNPAVNKNIKAKERLAELDQEAGENKKTLNRLEGTPDTKVKKSLDELVKDSPEVTAADKLLSVTKSQLRLEENELRKKEFIEMSGMVDASTENIKKYYDEQAKQGKDINRLRQEFEERVEAKLKIKREHVAKLEAENLDRRAKVEEKLRKKLDDEEREENEKYLKEKGLEQRPTPRKTSGTPATGPDTKSVDKGRPDDRPLPTGTKGLLEQISRGEGTSDEKAKANGYASGYDVTLGYGAFNKPTNKPLSEMTLGEVKSMQREMLRNPANKFNSSAAGKYQIVMTTLLGLQKEMNLRDDEVYSAALQDKMGEALLNRRGLAKFKEGKISAHQFQKNLTPEWTSIADPDTGRGHQGTGSSDAQMKKAIAGVTAPAAPAVAAVPKTTAVAAAPVPIKASDKKTLTKEQAAEFSNNWNKQEAENTAKKPIPSVAKANGGGIFSGPKEGYAVQLHGEEMVVPIGKDVSKKELPGQKQPFDFAASNEKLAASFDIASSKLVARQQAPKEKPVVAAKQKDYSITLDKIVASLDPMATKLLRPPVVDSKHPVTKLKDPGIEPGKVTPSVKRLDTPPTIQKTEPSSTPSLYAAFVDFAPKILDNTRVRKEPAKVEPVNPVVDLAKLNATFETFTDKLLSKIPTQKEQSTPKPIELPDFAPIVSELKSLRSDQTAVSNFAKRLNEQAAEVSVKKPEASIPEMTTPPVIDNSAETIRLLMDMTEKLTDRLDSVIGKLEENNHTQDKLLQHSRS